MGNDKISGNAFETGDKDQFSICDEANVGDIYKINIRGGWDTWKPRNIVVNGLHFNYDCYKEIEYAGVDQILSNVTKTYNIVVETAGCLNCGVLSTYTTVKMKLYGKINDAVTDPVTIEDLGEYSDKSWPEGQFMTGAIDNCSVQNQKALDEIEKISIQGVFYNPGDSWTIEKITVNGYIFEFDGAITQGEEYFSK